MALEARAFTAPVRRATIRPMPDSQAQRLGRWLLGLATIVLIVATISGRLALP
jgi:hypothetical protein